MNVVGEEHPDHIHFFGVLAGNKELGTNYACKAIKAPKRPVLPFSAR
jgi:hypothetical protein